VEDGVPASRRPVSRFLQLSRRGLRAAVAVSTITTVIELRHPRRLAVRAPSHSGCSHGFTSLGRPYPPSGATAARERCRAAGCRSASRPRCWARGATASKSVAREVEADQWHCGACRRPPRKQQSTLLGIRVRSCRVLAERRHARPSSTRPANPLSGLLDEGKSYPKELYGLGLAAQAGKSRALIRSATYGSAALAAAERS